MSNRKKKILKEAKRTHVQQYNQSWCGLACMSSVVKYYGGVAKQEQMIINSGTTITGTTMLGLYQLASHLGLKAEGYEADSEKLKEISDITILHIVNEKGMPHYVVCYGWDGEHFIIGDPGKGVIEVTVEYLTQVWKSKLLLLLIPSEKFVKEKEFCRQRWLLLKELTYNDWGVLSFAITLGIILAGLGLTIAIFTQKLIDKLIPSGDLKKLITALVVIFLLLIAKNILSYIRSTLLIRQSKDFGNRVVSFFFETSIMLPKRFFDCLRTGDMVARLNDARRLQQVLSTLTSSMIIDFLSLIAALSLLFEYSKWLGLTSFSAVLVFPIITLLNSKRIKDCQKEVMVAYATSESYFVNTIQGIEAIKSSQVEKNQCNKVARAYGIFQTKSYELNIFSNKLGLIFQVTATIILITMISLGALGVLEKWLTIGEMISALTLTSTIVGTAASLSLAFIQLQEANVAFIRLHDFIQGDKEENFKENEAYDLVIENIFLKGVSFGYPGRSLLLNKVTMELQRGKITCLIGDIGVGKSTILQLLQRFYIPSEGTIEVNSKNWNSIETPIIRRYIGIAPQEVKLLNASLLENIVMQSNSESLKLAELMCNQLGFNRFFEQLPLGLLTPIGEDGVNLSGGQRQLLGLCRAIIRKPTILLLDEPTVSLDKEAAKFVKDLIHSLKKECIILIVTHLPDMLSISDNVYQFVNKTLIQKDKEEVNRELSKEYS